MSQQHPPRGTGQAGPEQQPPGGPGPGAPAGYQPPGPAPQPAHQGQVPHPQGGPMQGGPNHGGPNAGQQNPGQQNPGQQHPGQQNRGNGPGQNPDTPKSSSRYVVVRSVLMVVVLALASWSFAQAWSPAPVAWLALLLATIVAAVLMWGLRRVGLVSFVAALVGIAVPVLMMLMVGRSAGRTLLDSFIAPFPELLTTAPPAPTTLPLLVPGLVLAWLVGITVGLATGARSGRTIGVFASLAGGLVLYIAAQLFTAGESDPMGLIGAAMVLVWLADWSLWYRASAPGDEAGSANQPHIETRENASGGALLRAGALALVFAILASLATVLPLGEPFRPQELVQRQDDLNTEPNPMPMLAQWAKEPEAEVLRRGGEKNVPLHLAVMKDYDGITFRPPMRPYDPVGDSAPPHPPVGGQQTVARTTITWPMQTRWLPAPGYPNISSLPDAQVNSDTGTMIVPDVPSSGVLSYQVTSVVSQPDFAQLENASVPDLPEYTAAEGVPQPMVDYADELTSQAETPMQKARALEEGIKHDRSFSSEMPGGHSYGRLQTFLLAPGSEGGRAGTSEQFASAFTVLARAEGLPTRLVVGFGPGTPMDGGQETNVVRGKDALAWPEVYFEGQGWVAFNPTPETEDISPIQQEPPDANPPGTPPDPPEPPDPGGADHDQDDTSTDQRWLLFLLPILAVVAILGALVGARAWRRRGQRARGAIGAWQQVLDSLTLAGQKPQANHSARQRAAGLPANLADSASRIAVAAEQQAFSADHANPQGDPAFEDVSQINAELRAEAPWWRRALWSINPLPLFRRQG